MLLNTDVQQIYTMYGGRVKVVSGTMIVNIAMNIGYVKLFSVEQLKTGLELAILHHGLA